MKQSIGGTYLIYFISIFILIVFAFLCGIMNYMKAFKVNSTIANALENNSGYNAKSAKEISDKLNSIGYRKGNAGVSCKSRRRSIKVGKTSIPVMQEPVAQFYSDDIDIHDFCIYEINETKSGCSSIIKKYVNGDPKITADEVSKCRGKIRYGIVTYIYLDLPIISEIIIPIYSESESIYLFEEWSKTWENQLDLVI